LRLAMQWRRDWPTVKSTWPSHRAARRERVRRRPN